MAILSEDIFSNHGPYIHFADCADRVTENNLTRQKLSPFVFFKLSEDLLGVYCSITNSYSPIDSYEDIQLSNPHDIRVLASELLFWAMQVLRTRQHFLRTEVLTYSFYEGTQRPSKNGQLTGENLRLDLVDTLLFLAGRFNRIAHYNRCLVISAI